MSPLVRFGCLAICTLVCAGLTVSPPLAVDKDTINALLDLMSAEFRSEDAAEADRIVDRRVRVHAPLLGEHVVYLQVNSGPELKVYRQRLLVFSFDQATGAVLQRALTFKQPGRFVDGFESPSLFEGLSMSDIEPTLGEGCEQVWLEHKEEWAGTVSPETCRTWSDRRKEWRRIGAESILTPTFLYQAERGFNDEGVQVFGTAPGEFYQLKRVSPGG